MKRVLKKNKANSHISYILDVGFEVKSQESKVAASNRVNNPTKVRPNTILFTDRSLQIYNRILDNVIGTIEGQGFVPVDESKWSESTESYVYYPKFKLPDYPYDRFNVVFRLSNTEDRYTNSNNELVRGTVRYTIRIVLGEEMHLNKNTGRYNIVGVNLFRLQVEGYSE